MIKLCKIIAMINIYLMNKCMHSKTAIKMIYSMQSNSRINAKSKRKTNIKMTNINKKCVTKNADYKRAVNQLKHENLYFYKNYIMLKHNRVIVGW